MAEPMRIPAEKVHEKLQEEDSIVLVCAYIDDTKFSQMRLEGAIPFMEFESTFPTLPDD